MEKLHLWEDLSGEYPLRIGTISEIVKDNTSFYWVDVVDEAYNYDSNTLVDYSDLQILETETKTRIDYNKLERIIEIDRNVTLEGDYCWPVTLKGITTDEFLNFGFMAAEKIKIKNAIGTQSVFTPICDNQSVIYTALGIPVNYNTVDVSMLDNTPVFIAEQQDL